MFCKQSKGNCIMSSTFVTSSIVIIVALSSFVGRVKSEELLGGYTKTWDLQDVTIIPGQAFIYNLPSEEYKYLVTESGLDFLPEWLEYDEIKKQLLGMPRSEDVGKNYFFEVKSASDASLSDLFKVEVKDMERLEVSEGLTDGDEGSTEVRNIKPREDQHHLRHHHNHHHHHQSGIRCKKAKSQTMASVILDVVYNNVKFTLKDRISTLEKFSKFYELPLEGIRLISSSEIGDGMLFDNSALVAGPGDVTPTLKTQTPKEDEDKESKASSSHSNKDHTGTDDAHVILKWTVGCGSVQKRHLVVLQRIEKDSLDGTLRKVLGRGIIGWYVTNHKSKERRRRYLKTGSYPTPTPTLSATPPTALVSYPPPKVISPPKPEVEPNATPVLTSTTQTITTTTTAAATASVVSQKATKSLKQKTTKARKQTQKQIDVSSQQPGLVEFRAMKSFDLIRVTIGEVFMLNITSDCFSDHPSKLELLETDGMQLSDVSWIKLSAPSRGAPYLYGIPLLNHEGLQEYILQGMNNFEGVAQINLKFEVMRFVGILFFEANVVFDKLVHSRFTHDVDLRMNVTRSIASALSTTDRSDSFAPNRVLMTRVEQGSVDYWWTDRTLSGKHSSCPENDVRKIQDRFINSSTLMVNSRFLNAVKHYGLSYAEFLPGVDCQLRGMRGLMASYIYDGVKVTPRVRVVLNFTTHPSVPYKHSVDDNRDDLSGGITGIDEGPSVEASRDEELLKQIIIPVLIVVALVLLSIIIACLVCRRRVNKQHKTSDATELVSKGAPVIFAHELDENHPPPTLAPRPLIAAAGERSPRPPNYHRRMAPADGGYGDFYASEGLMGGPRGTAGSGGQQLYVST